MKHLVRLFLVLIINTLLIIPNGHSQSDLYEFDVACKVQQVYPSISITEQELADAKTLIDLNRHYKPSWVKEYRSVDITATYNGTLHKVKSSDNKITPEQKALMQNADLGSEINVVVHYIPENNLQNNEARFEDFSITIDPTKSATYPSGQKALNAYFAAKVLDKADHSVFVPYNLSSIQFTVTEEGQVVNAHIVHSSENESTDKILLESVCNMPNWNPAQYNNGTKTKQDFVLTVGDLSSCKMNLLNVRNLAVEQH